MFGASVVDAVFHDTTRF